MQNELYYGTLFIRHECNLRVDYRKKEFIFLFRIYFERRLARRLNHQLIVCKRNGENELRCKQICTDVLLKNVGIDFDGNPFFRKFIRFIELIRN
jgi:hypothetical protein